MAWISDVALFTIWYIHPPHHGHTKVTVMVINDQFALFRSVSIGPPILEIRLFKILTLKIKVKVMDVQYPVDLLPFCYTSVRPIIPEIELFQNLTWKIQGQEYGWGQRSRSLKWPSTQPMHSIFVSHQLLNKPFLGYGQKCLTLKNHIWNFEKKKMPENSF